jgi:hypothetical protein
MLLKGFFSSLNKDIENENLYNCISLKEFFDSLITNFNQYLSSVLDDINNLLFLAT